MEINYKVFRKVVRLSFTGSWRCFLKRNVPSTKFSSPQGLIVKSGPEAAGKNILSPRRSSRTIGASHMADRKGIKRGQ